MGKQLHEVMGWPGPMTHRQYVTWQAWLDEQWDVPDRTDHYLMRIAQRIQEFAEGFTKDPRAVTIAEQKIPFERVQRQEEKPQLTIEQDKHLWAGALGTTLRKLRGK